MTVRDSWNSRIQHDRIRGVVTLEVILALPIFLIALMAITEFGLLLSNELYVEAAAHAGAQAASELTGISETNGSPVPLAVRNAVATELVRIGISDYSVRLEHNIDTVSPITNPVVELVSVVGTGPTNCPDPPPITLIPNRTYVRVTVCVKSNKLTPNLLKIYGIDMAIRVSDETALRRYTL